MFLKILLLTWTQRLILQVQPSLVFDSSSQKGIHISDYCPAMEHCAEGAHVMCMYYDPNRVYGPRCSEPKNVTMTSELAVKLLEVTNAIRGKLAMGNERGKGNEKLPRAYGMFKLQWDNELATFAQVLANQCLMRHDLCRATKRFPDPGQTVSKIRFTIPEWYPAGSKARHYSPGLTESKLIYSITQSLKTWYSHKSSVTPDMVAQYPDWSINPTKDSGRLYMEMVHGPATHMGCGISAFVDYAYNNNRSPLNFNAIQIVCNYAERPKVGKPVYDIEPSVEISKCGCPPLTNEDENCLCSYVDDNINPRNKHGLQCAGANCEQTVILLPIFTIEDAPHNKLLGRQGSNALLPTDSLEIMGAHFPGNGSNGEHPIVKVLDGIMNGHRLDDSLQYSARTSNRKAPASNQYHKQPPTAAGHVSQRKTSIFSRSAIIGAPKALTLKDLKKSVIPRKDFSKAKHLVNDYMETAKNLSNVLYKSQVPESEESISKKILIVTENLNNAEENVITHTLDNDTLHSKHDEIQHHEKDRDSKLMTLLEQLEKEAQHINLRGPKKEMFDAKIRRIYDSVLGKSSGLPIPKATHHAELESAVNGVIQKLREHDSHKKETAGHAEDTLFDDIGKTIIDDLVNNHNDNTHPINLDEDNDVPKSRRTKMKSRADEPYNTNRDGETDYDLIRRENAIKSPQTEKLTVYRDSDTEYKPYRYLEHRQSYKPKSQDHSYEKIKTRFSADEGIRRDKRLKHTRDYYKNRNTNSVEGFNKNHYRRHQVNPDDIEDDVLSPARRKYYQERLENLERKIHNTRSHKYRYNEDIDHRRRATRLSSDDEAQRRPSMNHLEHFDMRERSRFLHGY